jgi:Polyketide cyclase / dehydrase and lipid transport
MQPVTVTVEVGRPRQEVFDFVDVLANREGWMDHLYKDWTFEGPRRGVGGIAKAQVDAPSARERVTLELTEAKAPERIVEEVDSAHGKRRTRSTYTFVEAGAGRTRIEFEFEWLKAPRTERLAPPVSHAFMQRAQGKSLKKLAAQLEKG